MAFVDNTTGGRVIKEGKRPVSITLSGTVKVGDLIGYASGWKAADMDSSPKNYPELVAAGPGVSGDVIVAFREAVIDFGTGCTATADDRVYATTTAGQYVGVASNDQGDCVGVMVDAQTAFINPFYAFPNVKIPNVEYTNTTGTVILLQLKSALAATGSASLSGIEIAPKVLNAIAGGSISGIKVAIDLEGTSAGTITLAQCYEAALGSDSGTVRTVTTATCFRAINNMHGTVTNGPYVIDVVTHGGNVAWAAFARLPDVGANQIADLASASTTVNAVIKCVVGSTVTYLTGYATYTPA
ncbi:MAG: hypothetical protein Q7O66_07390 [Dehalococcoidia bacterium]|nr:hypothetical protein [Dehalococcoidia bacterium]